MATSGTTDFNLEIDQIIDDAFDRCGVEMRTARDLRSATRSLNLLFAQWANKGINRWKIEQTTLSMVVGQQDYNLGTDTIDILSAALRRDSTDFPMIRLSMDEWLSLPNKSVEARPIQFYVDRQINPVLRVWFTPDRATDTMIFDRLVRIEDAGAYTNNADVPFRFLEPMTAGLAYGLSIKYAPDRVQVLKAMYDDCMREAMHEDRDRASFTVTPYCGGYS
jgi:hypothetical protein